MEDCKLVIVIQTKSAYGMDAEEMPISELELALKFIKNLKEMGEFISAVIVDRNAKGAAKGKYIPIA